MITIAWRSLAARKLAILAALLSVVVGSALVTATLLIAGAQERQGAASVTSWRFDAVDAVVKPPASVTLNSGLKLDLPSMPRLSPAQIDAVRDAPGVASVDLEPPFPAYLVNSDSTVIGDAFTRSWGHPWSTAIADGASVVKSREPATARDVVVDESVATAGGVSVGDEVRIQLATGTEKFTVSGIARRASEQFEHALFFDGGAASRFGGAPVMALVSTTDTAALQAAVPGLEVITGRSRAGSLQLDLRQAELAGGSGQFLMVIAFLALTIAMFVISSTLTVSIGQRRRELAMLRVVGTRPRLLRRLVTWEAFFIGAFGGVLGTGAGIALADVARRFFVAQGLMARGAAVSAEPFALLIGIGAAVGAALVAAWLPARRATRIAPLEALRESDVPTGHAGGGRSVFGWVLLTTAAGCTAGAFAIGGPVATAGGAVALLLVMTAFLLFIGAAVLLGPHLLRGVLTPLGSFLRRRFEGFVAERSIRSDLRRAAGVSVPLTLLVAVSAVLMFQDSANYQARAQVYAEQVTADAVVSGGVQLGVPLSAVNAIEQAPSVATASASISSRLVIDTPSTMRSNGTVTGVDPDGFGEVLAYDVISGSWANFGEHSIGVSQIVAEEKQWRIGGTVTFLYPDGTPGSAVLSTIYRDLMGVSDMVLPVSKLAPHLLEPYASAVYVAFKPGADQEAALAAINDKLASVAPGAQATDRDGHLAQVATQASGDNWIIQMVVVLLGGYAGVSAVNVLIGSTMSRRREFALLRLAGARRSQIARSLLVESLLVATTAVVAGSAIATVTMIGYGYLLTDTIWLPFVGSAFVAIVACAYLAAAVGTLAPARTAMKVGALEATR
ncbi:FtsX-like permease family protein [Streptosporangium saharense]|uniref:Putative ABC transport system permease protein n=1 Tax=Streptosporangium saharense TaxID=1706840 RepID=A0A7W7VSM9_9ACTN|nr:ABC transporter permease [Streptosporangium saharense]MBB4920610.1 putative ABC transport system permease protein [Streptosporangium saharense]